MSWEIDKLQVLDLVLDFVTHDVLDFLGLQLIDIFEKVGCGKFHSKLAVEKPSKKSLSNNFLH